jgi:hypothetical protein
MFAIDYPHRGPSVAGHMKHAMKSSNIPEQSQRKAVIQSAHDEAPRPVRKNRLRNRKIACNPAMTPTASRPSDV